MTDTTRSRNILRDGLKLAGARPEWLIAGNMGTLECWNRGGEILLIQSLPADGGVEVYKPVETTSFDDLLTKLGLVEVQ